MGLIYVNPEGPNGNPDPLAAAHDIRETFGRMAMNDEETVALIAGGHSFGKTHGAGIADDTSARSRRAPRSRSRAWAGRAPTAPARAATPSPAASRSPGPSTPTKWGNEFFENLFGYEWELEESPAGAKQWVAKDAEATFPDPTADSPKRKPTMLTTDLSLRFDPAYEKISRRFLENPDEFALAFAKAWYKLLHRDMGPVSPLPRPVGARAAAVAGPGAGRRPRARGRRRHRRPQGEGPRLGPLGRPAGGDRLGVGLDLPRHRQARRRQRRPHPARAAARLGGQRARASSPRVLEALEGIQQEFNAEAAAAKISLADLIVLAGSAAVEKAARDAGVEVTVPFHPGRTDASQEQTDVESFAVLEPRADGFRNYLPCRREAAGRDVRLLDRANLLRPDRARR